MSKYFNNNSLSSSLVSVSSNVKNASNYVTSGLMIKDSAAFISSAINILKQLYSLSTEINSKFNTKDNRNILIKFIQSFFIQIGQLIISLKNTISSSSNMTPIEQNIAEKFIDGIFNLIVLLAVIFGAGGILNKGGFNKNQKHKKYQNKTKKHKKTRSNR
jgi:hypothetical protein